MTNKMEKMSLVSKIVKFSLIGAAASIGSLAIAGGADAATIVQTASFPGGGGTTSTNFLNQPVIAPISQFNSSLGILNSVTVRLDGIVAGSARIESLDASPSSITVNQSAQVTFSVTGVGNVVQVIPLATQNFNASPFDGGIDFGGTSGVTFANLTATANNTTTLTTGLAPFIGTGTIAGLLTGAGASNATGSGNLITQFLTQAGGTVTVTYNYTTPQATTTPEPATVLGLATVAGLGLLKRKKA